MEFVYKKTKDRENNRAQKLKVKKRYKLPSSMSNAKRPAISCNRFPSTLSSFASQAIASRWSDDISSFSFSFSVSSFAFQKKMKSETHFDLHMMLLVVVEPFMCTSEKKGKGRANCKNHTVTQS